MSDPAVTTTLGPEEASTTSMVDEVYSALLTSIVEARLGAGTPLSQNKLASHLGVSRTPVREALLRLESEGLVERVPDAGFVVSRISADEVNEACDLIVLLDTFVYSRATAALGDGDLQRLRALAGEMVGHAEAGEVDAWKSCDDQYHDLVMGAAANRYVAEVLTRARHRVQRFGLPERHVDGRLVTCSLDHVALADAMLTRDEDALAALVEAHIERLRTNVLNRLASAAPLLPGRDPLSLVIPSS